MKNEADLPGDLRPLYEAAVALGAHPDVFRVFTTLARDAGADTRYDGAELLRDQGIDVPEGLTVTLGPDVGRPVPGEWWPFEILLSNCRKFYRLTTDKQPPQMEETETVWFTVAIRPRPIPGGLWG